jgi:hypothetical protein
MLRTQAGAALERKDTWAEVLTWHISHRMLSMTLRPLQGHGTAMEGSVMSLSAWEQQALDSIKDGLASSDPTLVARLAIFTRLVSGEEMPTRERVHADMGRPALRTRPGPARHVRMQRTAVLLWLGITMALIAVALVFNRNGNEVKCPGSWVTFCAGTNAAAKAAPGLP